MDEGHTYAEAIEYLSEQGVVEGYDDGSYKPDQEINRAEFLKIVMTARDPTVAGNAYSKKCFPDVDLDEWYAPYVCAAKELGIVEGYPSGDFEPDSTINMAEALKITLGSYDYPIEETDPWYEGVMDQAEDLKLLPETYERADQWVNRGEMAEIMYRLTGDYDFTQEGLDREGLDAMEEEFLALLNDYRADLGLDPLDDDLNLNRAALLHSEWMYETGIYSHEGKNGSSHTQRCIDSGTYCYGEILMLSYNPDPQGYLEAWQGSFSHNATMTRWYYTDVGISFYEGYATVVFSFTYDPGVDYGW